MKVTCPECGFEGNIKDDLISESGKDVTCPKCKRRFRVSKTPPPSQVMPPAPLKAPHRGGISTPAIKGKGNDPTKTMIYILAALLILGVGYVVGRTHESSKVENSKTAKIDESTKTNTPKTITPVPKKSEPIPKSNLDTSEERELEDIEKVKPPPKPETINEEDFVSDEYIDVSKIDMLVNKWYELTEVKREKKLKEYIKTLVSGKMLTGTFEVTDVSKMGSYSSKKFPKGMYTYLIEAESDSHGVWETTIYIGVKDNETLVNSLDKGTRINVEGFIYYVELPYITYRIYLVNCKIEFLD